VEIRMHLSDHFARIAVRDSGPGIAEAELPHVFDRYWQLDRADGRGAGLGLAIVRGIAEAHGGSVEVESPPGDGATFHLEVPLA
jgi:signal transduction histidine kinase